MSQKVTTANVIADATESHLVSHPRMMPRPRLITPADAPLDLVRDTLLALVRRDGRDLTARQLCAFMIVYSCEQVQTVSSLAELLNISRPGVTRVMDRLVRFDLLAREEDSADRRRVLARHTVRGAAFYRDLMAIAAAGGADIRAGAAAPSVFTGHAGRA